GPQRSCGWIDGELRVVTARGQAAQRELLEIAGDRSAIDDESAIGLDTDEVRRLRYLHRFGIGATDVRVAQAYGVERSGRGGHHGELRPCDGARDREQKPGNPGVARIHQLFRVRRGSGPG